ncbi:DUF6809 family protein [Chryseobacterium sp.]|uniref:DUF6809 family protein n=1 Tax=Chryseobacterium sp. TaxID=1871047 RepID=UPI002FCA4F9F
MIEEIWYGNVGGIETLAPLKNQLELATAKSDNYDALIATLNKNQIALLTTFLDSLETENIETLANAYKTGVKLGMRLAIESTTAEDDWR